MNITKCGNRLETSAQRKSTNTGLLLHYHGHVEKRYKGCLLSTMINRAYRLSSTPTAFSDECDKLRTTFLNLDYPVNLINSSINKFLRNIDNNAALDDASDGTSNIVAPLLKPVFQSSFGHPRPQREEAADCQQSVRGLQISTCDTEYVGYTTRHLHQRIGEHKPSAIGRHLELQFLDFLTVVVLTFVLSQCFIVKLLRKPILLRNSFFSVP